MMNRLNIFLTFCLLFTAASVSAQQVKEKDDLGDKEYIIVKDYKPVLAESYKISDSPEGDTATYSAPPLNYKLKAKQAETSFETATIKAVRVKEEALAKLYRNFVRLGIGNYTKYSGELYVNSLRSKKGALGLSAKHFSGSPALKDVGNSSYSENSAHVFGKYFLENALFYADLRYDRDVVHYYGYNTSDTIIDKDDIRQLFSNFAANAGIKSNHLSKGNIDYDASFGFSTLSDHYDVTENDFLVSATGGKEIESFYLRVGASYNYFKKSQANNESLSLLTDLSRSIIRLAPSVILSKDKATFELGGKMVVENDDESTVHFYPNILVRLPIAEHVIAAFAKVEGDVIKNSYRTITKENPFLNSAVVPLNSNEAIMLTGGLNGNFSSTVSFAVWVKYGTVKDMALFVNDSIYTNKFDLVYDDVNVLDLHAEMSYRADEKLRLSLRFDQFSYTPDLQLKAWHKPQNELSVMATYNLRDKIFVNASVFSRGKSYVRTGSPAGYLSEKLNGYIDGNLGIEYRYSKILSVYINLNNLSFSKYDLWYSYPSEAFNVLGGISYSF
ncbi:MAG: TonB-dependent receptor [Bacteroidia bacterium]|nr:TonB-dependent receptor [Bacteroidia bacterium]